MPVVDYAPYQALGSAEKLALVQRVPPRTGETQEQWYIRAMGGTKTPPVPYGGGPRVDAPITYGSVPIAPPDLVGVVKTQANGGSANVVSQVGQALIGMGVPAALIAGLPAAALSALGVAYGISQAVGVQYPWETGPGEGFIAPWTREIVQDESGRWVTRETRPDLFNGAVANGGAAMVPTGVTGAYGPQVVKTWTANGWPFAMTSDGRIHTVTKSGIRKSWKPYRSVVLGKNPSPRQLSRAVSKMVQFDKLHQKIQKMARRIKT